MPNLKWVNEDGTRMTCQYAECEEPVRCHGLCSRHYQHFYYQSSKNSWF